MGAVCNHRGDSRWSFVSEISGLHWNGRGSEKPGWIAVEMRRETGGGTEGLRRLDGGVTVEDEEREAYVVVAKHLKISRARIIPVEVMPLTVLRAPSITKNVMS